MAVIQGSSKKMNLSSIKVLAWSVFITGILYYCVAYLLRVFPSVMENDLLAQFHITAGDFGILTTAYYFSYAPMQLPVGVTVDRFGARNSLLFSSAMSILGVLVFTLSSVYWFAVLGYFLIGFGSSFAYVTALKIATVWLPRKYFATATGVVTGAGMAAAIFTDIYITHIVQTWGYRETIYLVLAAAIILFLLIYLMVKEKPKGEQTEQAAEQHALSYKELLQNLWTISKKPQMWVIGTVGALLYLPASVFTDTWGIPYLEASYHLTPVQAGWGVSLVLIGWIVSSFLMGALSDILGTRKIPLMLAAISATLISSFIFFVPNLSRSLLYFLLLALGLSCGPHPLCFTLSKENNAGKISGTSVAFANFVIMMGGFVFKPVVGKLLDLGWSGLRAVNGVPIYSMHDFTIALSFMPIGLFVAFLLTLLIKETYMHSEKQDS